MKTLLGKLSASTWYVPQNKAETDVLARLLQACKVRKREVDGQLEYQRLHDTILSEENVLLSALEGNDQFWEALRVMGEAYWDYMEAESEHVPASVLKEIQATQELAVAEVLVASGMWDLIRVEREK